MAKPPMPPHVQTAYKDAIDNIMYSKKLMFDYTYYAVLLYGAVYALGDRISKSSLPFNYRYLVFGLVVMIFVLHTAQLLYNQHWIGELRKRLAAKGGIYDTYFEPEEREGLRLGEFSVRGRDYYDVPLTAILLTVSLVVGGLVWSLA